MGNYRIIGVDNGYGLTKTVHETFITSLKNHGDAKPALMEKVVCYKGNYYAIGVERNKVKTDKTDNDQTYILTLAAMAEELKRDGVTESEVVLSVGLPLERCGKGADDFAEYFKRETPISFTYENVPYTIALKDVLVFPQGYSAIIKDIRDIPDGTVIVDIGSWTVDILQLVNGVASASKSLNDGAITCIIAVNDAIRREFGYEVMEHQIQEIMQGKKNVLPEKYTEIAEREIRNYVEKLAATLQEHKFNTETLPFIFVGGGSCMIKNYGMHLFNSARVIPEVNANAVGYEAAAKLVYR